MKQKIVIRVSMHDDKCRSKALKIVVGISGVESAALTGAEKDQLEVIGNEIDAVVLTRALRKKLAPADLFPVPPPGVWYTVPYYNGPHYPVYEVSHDPSCTIM
ncbi:heavy metal-associated isoprenylated plant protein 46-like [Forsythia ovata]|uniref:Heavy metal-associated isoprenylated plant protein 46-like n=1 Tax=Forsythia ovata TaxID=205694 RepID=A0ABD1S8W0_9LAMI